MAGVWIWPPARLRIRKRAGGDRCGRRSHCGARSSASTLAWWWDNSSIVSAFLPIGFLLRNTSLLSNLAWCTADRRMPACARLFWFLDAHLLAGTRSQTGKSLDAAGYCCFPSWESSASVDCCVDRRCCAGRPCSEWRSRAITCAPPFPQDEANLPAAGGDRPGDHRRSSPAVGRARRRPRLRTPARPSSRWISPAAFSPAAYRLHG